MQFNTIDLNGFKATHAMRTEKFLNYGHRDAGRFNLSSHELASIYHFPHRMTVPHIVHVLAKKWNRRGIFRKTSCIRDQLSVFGITNFHNQNFKFGLKREDRRRHLYGR